MLKSLAVVAALIAAVSADGQYAPAGEIHVGGVGRFDYLAVDSAAKRLYLSHGTEVVVIDTATDTIAQVIEVGRNASGIALGRLAVAAEEGE